MSCTTISPRCSWFTNDGLPRRRDGPWAYLVLFYLFTGGFFTGGLSFGFGVILPILMKSFNSNREQTALAGSLSLGIGLFLCVFSSKICERYTCRIANSLGLIAIATGLTLSSLCKSIDVFYFAYSLFMGIGGSLAYTSMFLAVRQYFKKRYSVAMGAGSAGSGVGTLAFGPLMQSMTDSFGWQNTFRILAGVYCLLLLLNIVLDPNVEEEFQQENERISNNLEAEVSSVPRKIVFGFLDLSVWRFPEFTLCVVGIFVGSFGHYTSLFHMVKYSEELSIPPSKGSTLFVFFGSGSVISRIISGRLCDIACIEPRYVYQVGVIISGVCTILLSFAKTYIHLAIFAVVYGLADGAFRLTVNILFMHTVDISRRASAFGQGNMAVSFSTSIGPAIAGLIADNMGSYKNAFYMAGACSILSGVILFAHYLYCCCNKFIKGSQQGDQNHNCSAEQTEDRELGCIGPGAIEDESQTTVL